MPQLKILCLHGSRQDNVVFSQRIKVLTKKAAGSMQMHFAQAPHELPLLEDQEVAMRAWWRHPKTMEITDAAEEDGQAERLPGPPVEEASSSRSGGSSQLQGSDWEAQIVADWEGSLRALEGVWRDSGGFDAILGFSNGAAATFLLAAHVLARPADFPGRRLRCAIMAGGYVPQPLDRLLPHSTEITRTLRRAGEDGADSLQLAQPLCLPSLHIFSPQDGLVSAEQSKQLAAQFDASRSQKMEHELGHCVPQKANHVNIILDFLSWFEPPPDEATLGQLPEDSMDQPVSMTAAETTAFTGLEDGNDGGGQSLQGGAQHQEELQPPAEATGDDGPIDAPEAVQGAIPTPEQQEEIEALQAIFEGCFSVIPSSPTVRIRVRLRDPLMSSEPELEDAEGSAEAIAKANPSALFSLDCTLPEGYPSQGQLPDILISGPVLSPDLTSSLLSHLKAIAQENVAYMSMGCIYQVVEAAKEWLDTNLPPDFSQSYASRNLSSNQQHKELDTGCEAESKTPPWWENEEADANLVTQAIAEASASRNWLLPGAARKHQNAGTGDTSAATADAAGGMHVAEAADSMQHGRWDYVVGLVGKPSAGKSSFFNAVTQPMDEDEGARVAAFPFTTIDPQTGRGFAVVPDPVALLGPETASQSKPLHGYAPAFDLGRANPELNNTQPLQQWCSAAVGERVAEVAWRRVPIAVKDVAGLVPGAYQGRGRGNAFLNDLCEASVLVHVVDASGCTDKEGRAVVGCSPEGGRGAEGGSIEEGGDPLADIGWVREEIHRWVFNNVRTKWGSVRRRPSKLCDLFSGYHAPQALVYEVLEHVGLSVHKLLLNNGVGAIDTLCAWGEADLHKLVAAFLAARFPILLALNKCDTASAPRHIRRIREALPQEPAVAMSAASERWLATTARKGQVVYQDAAPSASVAPGCDDASVARQVAELNRRVLGPFGGTGALLAVSTAVAMRPPAVVFPVGDLNTCTALPARTIATGGGLLLGGEDAKARAAEGPTVLRDAVLMKPGSTPADLFSVLVRPPWQLLEGEFVRAEARVLQCGSSGHQGTHGKPSSASRTVLKKDDTLGFSNCVVRIMVNKKGTWQKH
uniref:RWD domain-containing protein n=1 Tax=Dunaliella tertiolecta TaxID=3047 RepID=A0A7S3R6V4_DUNTE